MNTEIKYYKASEVAKLVRAELKKVCPTTKFSVRSERSTINVTWTDGPLTENINSWLYRFRGSEHVFDGGDGYRQSVKNMLNDVEVSFGVDFIFCTRHFSATFLSEILDAKMVEYNYPVRPTIESNEWGDSWLVGGDMIVNRIDSLNKLDTLADVVYEAARKTAR